MTTFSRREFGKIVVAAAPLAALGGVRRLHANGPVTIGVSTSSFRTLPRVAGRDNVDDVIRALQAVRATRIELAMANVEPAPPSTAPVMGGSAAYPRRIVLTPEEVARTNVAARSALRTWRLQAPLAHFADLRARLAGAGVAVHACAIAYDDAFTDEEIEATFRQVTALGVSTISTPMAMAMARRLLPFIDRHHVSVAIHNHMAGNPAGAIETGRVQEVLALSPLFAVTLDIGHITASNGDAVADLRRYEARVSHVLVKDRLRNGGASQPFGEGDSPIAQVLAVLGKSVRPIPAFVEYDYGGLRPPEHEVATSMAYLSRLIK